MKAVVPAAGYGTRMQPFTSFRPKQMLPIAGKPILHRALEYIRDELGISNIVLIVGYLRDSIIDYFGSGSELGINIQYAVQHTHTKRGLGAALGLAQEYITSDFVVYLADNLFQANLSKVINLHSTTNSHATIHVEWNDNPSRYGVVVADDECKISQVIEKPKTPPSNWVISGFYVFSPLIFNVITRVLPSKRGEIELTDAIQRMIDRKMNVRCSRIEGWRQDIGYPMDLLPVNMKYLQEGHSEIKSDVNNCKIIEPVFIAEDCTLENSVIGPNITLEKGVTVKNSVVKDSVILESTVIENSTLEYSVIGSKCHIKNMNGVSMTVGDYSRVQPLNNHKNNSSPKNID